MHTLTQTGDLKKFEDRHKKLGSYIFDDPKSGSAESLELALRQNFEQSILVNSLK